MNRRNMIAAALTVFGMFGAAQGQEVRFYEENGITYRETREKVLRPVTHTELEERERTVYRQVPQTTTQKCCRTVRVPVTEYRTVTRWVGRYNPFVQPIPVQETVPVVRWETRTESFDVPVTRMELVAEKVTEKVPVMTRKMVEEEVTRRVAVTPAPASQSAVVRSTPPAANRIGGVARLDSDPPRQPTGTGWQSVPTRR